MNKWLTTGEDYSQYIDKAKQQEEALLFRKKQLEYELKLIEQKLFELSKKYNLTIPLE